jgi:enoyl-CoA hydratase
VRFETDGRCGVMVLDRPATLNALTTSMVRTMLAQLERWSGDGRIALVLLQSASTKAFCAGGDIKAMRAATLAGDDAAKEEFFSTEYALDELVATCPKPVLSIIDGICMGGGMGISVHGAFRVATERATFAMPETAIGFFPDVGASWFLPRLPGELGTYLGLTGARVGGADAVRAGLATHFVPAARLPELERAVRRVDDAGSVPSLLAGFAQDPPPSAFDGERGAIDRDFVGESAAAIVDALAAREEPAARRSLALLARASPASLAVTCALLRRGRRVSRHECFQQELRLGRVMTRSPDFLEGVRAVLVDKDQQPRWAYPDVRSIPAQELAAALEALEGRAATPR